MTVRISRGARGARPAYRVSASREGVELSIDENFWNDEVVEAATGTTALDHNIATVCAEIRAALYYIATDGTRH